ncbi:ABC transporter permease [Roseitranquillus sediminis]|uniref:ABC transporter permease n=1 Tax=Roseitranquillus sediminis TaxID=2809051 RepID=UPI001D0CC24E|nr:ABC transporter permease subunit [Roseitranquillus sediminis]MBM9594475.1 ABC transporter permease subunit [Roseitranquillus sediminis]
MTIAGEADAGRGFSRLPERAETVAILVAVLVGWEVLARTLLAGSFALAAPTQVAAQLAQNWPLYATNVQVTLWTALKGFAIGNAVAVVAAVLIVQWPALERPVFSAALAIYSLPIIALAPILMVLLDRPDAMVALSALAVIFTTMVAAVLGLRSADPAALEVVHVLGGSGRDKLIRVRLQSALPSLFAGLKIAAPASVLGATVGEFMGAERGLGVLITGALASLETTRVWSVAVLATALSGGGYVLVGWIGAWLTPWVHGLEISQAATRGGAGAGPGLLRTGATIAISLVVVFGGWALFIRLAGLNAFFAKGPGDVWAFLFTEPDAAANRALVFGGLLVTLGNAGLGFVAGMAGGTLAAIVFVLRPSVERGVMPIAITLRSIPILATTPLVILLLGRTLAATTVIVAILSFFPTMINMVTAMRLTRRQIVEVLHVMNASRLTILWRAELPSALPALMASARIAVPASILGAVIIEWLVTGVGMGNAILAGVYNADYAVLWAVAAILTLIAMATYGLVSVAERAVLRRYAPEQLA